MINRTFTMIKPDATEKGSTGGILQMINAAGFKIVAMKMTHLSKEKAGEFYAVHSERPFYGELVEFMSRGPITAAILEKDVKVAKPEISVSNFKYDAEIKESDVDKVVNVTFSTTNADYVYAYVNADNPLRVSANQGYISLFFNKDFLRFLIIGGISTLVNYSVFSLIFLL